MSFLLTFSKEPTSLKLRNIVSTELVILKKVINHYLLIFCTILSLVSYAQNETVCSGEKYTEFDFWEGNWNVYDQNENLIGENKLVKMQDNCVLQENWISTTSKNKGTSYNYYDKNDGKWHQI